MKYQFKTISADEKMTEQICERIKRLLVKSNYTQLQLSQEMGISKSTVSKWMHGESLTLDALYNLSKFFDCTIDYLLTGKDFAVRGIPKQPGDNSFDIDAIDNDVKTFYEFIKGKTLNGISLAGALNYLIADDLTYQRGRIANIDSRFIDTWATYLSIDTSASKSARLEDDELRLDYSLDYKTLENAILLNMINLLAEKKQRYKTNKNHLKSHAKKIERKNITAAEYEMEFESHTESEIAEYSKIADLNNPLAWEKGGSF